MLDNFTVVFRASGDALFYVVGDSDEVSVSEPETGWCLSVLVVC
jgi:hypothetical protein